MVLHVLILWYCAYILCNFRSCVYMFVYTNDYFLVVHTLLLRLCPCISTNTCLLNFILCLLKLCTRACMHMLVYCMHFSFKIVPTFLYVHVVVHPHICGQGFCNWLVFSFAQSLNFNYLFLYTNILYIWYIQHHCEFVSYNLQSCACSLVCIHVCLQYCMLYFMNLCLYFVCSWSLSARIFTLVFVWTRVYHCYHIFCLWGIVLTFAELVFFVRPRVSTAML